VIQAIREIAQFRTAIAIGVPVLGAGLALAASYLTPRGRAKGVITGGYMLLAAVGAACLLFAAIGLFAGEPSGEVAPLFVPGVALTVIMGLFSPEIIKEYQQFEFRRLAAEIFRRS
jgi:fatty acid desaturase